MKNLDMSAADFWNVLHASWRRSSPDGWGLPLEETWQMCFKRAVQEGWGGTPVTGLPVAWVMAPGSLSGLLKASRKPEIHDTVATFFKNLRSLDYTVAATLQLSPALCWNLLVDDLLDCDDTEAIAVMRTLLSDAAASGWSKAGEGAVLRNVSLIHRADPAALLGYLNALIAMDVAPSDIFDMVYTQAGKGLPLGLSGEKQTEVPYVGI